MFLTRMALNPARRGTHSLLGSPQRMHAAVLAAFPPDAATSSDRGRVLWRVDQGANRRVELYVSSLERPDLTHVVEQAGWPTTGTWETRDYQPLLSRLMTGQRWAFRLTANPVRSLRKKDGDPTRPVAHTTVHHQEQWLLSRCKGLGFAVTVGPPGDPDLKVKDRRTVSFERHANGSNARGHPVTLTMATFDGLMEVTDADQLRHALTHGVGRAKGYGCGLLTLAPLS